MTKWTVVQQTGIQPVEAETALEAAELLVGLGRIDNPPHHHVKRVWVVPVNAVQVFNIVPGMPTVQP